MIYEKTKAKEIVHEKDELKDAVYKTLEQMSTIVGATLGPGGRPVLIERDGQAPLITKDGVTVAKSLGVAEARNNVIIESAKEICINTAKEAGDGTTTAIVLADAIVKAGQNFISNHAKYNPQLIMRELNNLYKDEIVPFIKDHSEKADTETILRNVALISANGDEEIAELAVEAVMAAGDDGVVLFEEAQGKDSYLDDVEGFVVTNGLTDIGQLANIFINDEEGQQNLMDGGLILLYDGTISSLDVMGAVQDAIEGTDYMGKPIIVMAHKFTDNVLDRFAKTVREGYNIVPLRTPMSGLKNSRTILLHDLAAYTGAEIMDIDKIKNFELEHFGDFDGARINMFESFIVAEPDQRQVDIRINELKKMLEDSPDEYSQMHLRSHISRLTGGIATLFVGGATSFEIRERKDRAEDAVEAVRSAISEGVVAGGCYMHQLIKKHVMGLKNYKASYDILVKALDAPIELLLLNCGEDPVEVLKEFEKQNKKRPMIFDAQAHAFIDPIAGGIIEPAKVCRVGLGNALSVASLLITLGGIVVVPRDAGLENQLAMQKSAFQDMMGGVGG